MGLELEALVIHLEEEFEITIPDTDAERMTTPGKIVDYLISRPEVSGKWSRDYVHLSTWMIIEIELGIDRNEFNDDSGFIQDMGAG